VKLPRNVDGPQLVVLGSGHTLFGRDRTRLRFRLIESRPTASGTVILRYEPMPETPLNPPTLSPIRFRSGWNVVDVEEWSSAFDRNGHAPVISRTLRAGKAGKLER
jgi:hypothetical protein